MKLHHKSNPALLHSPININYINDLPLISTTVELNFLDSFSFDVSGFMRVLALPDPSNALWGKFEGYLLYAPSSSNSPAIHSSRKEEISA